MPQQTNCCNLLYNFLILTQAQERTINSPPLFAPHNCIFVSIQVNKAFSKLQYLSIKIIEHLIFYLSPVCKPMIKFSYLIDISIVHYVEI